MRLGLILMLVVGVALAVAVQRDEELPAEATMLYQRLAYRMSGTVRSWVITEARQVKFDARYNENAIRSDALAQFAGRPLAMSDQDALVFLVLMETVQGMDRDIRLAQIQAERTASAKTITNKVAASTNTTAQTASVTTAVADTRVRREQELKERRAKFVATLSGIARKISPLQDSLLESIR